MLRHRQCTLHVFRRGIKSRVWKRGGSTSPELYVGPIHAIKKQSKFEKCMRKAVKKDTEMRWCVKPIELADPLPDSCSCDATHASPTTLPMQHIPLTKR